MEFTYYAYCELIKQISKKYVFSNYHNFNAVNCPCILRHDVDMNPQKAVEMAKVEAELGVGATYFILVNTGFYNICSSEVIGALKQIQAFGHELGLHFDEKKYEDCNTENEISKRIIHEAQILSSVVDTPISTVSMHRPSQNTLEADYTINGFINSYGKTFFKNFKYLSDSRMHWRENVEDIVKSCAYKSLHILTHPLWYHDQSRSMQDILSDFVKSGMKSRYDFLRENFQNLTDVFTYEELLAGK